MSRILGIDYGAKRTGLAISDTLNKDAIPLDVISSPRTSTVRIAERIRKLGVDVLFESEHLTSEAASDIVRRQVARSGVPIDDIAASVILQQYLNSKNSDS